MGEIIHHFPYEYLLETHIWAQKGGLFGKTVSTLMSLDNETLKTNISLRLSKRELFARKSGILCTEASCVTENKTTEGTTYG